MKLYKDIRFSTITLSYFNSKMVELCFWLLLFSFQILVLTGLKPHYFLVTAISLIIFVINLQPYINVLKSIYFLPLFTSILYHVLFNRNIDLAFILSILNYVIIPLVFFHRSFYSFDLYKSVYCFKWFTVLCFVGLMLQIVGVEAPFLDLEFAITDGIVKHRYGSIAGSTLVLGFFTSISFIYCFYNYIYLKDSSKQNIVFLIISLISLFLAQSRRYYVFTFIICALIFYFGKTKRTSLKYFFSKYKYYLISILLFFLIAFFLKDDVFLFARFYSTFDYKNDASNVLRAIKWIEAILNFVHHFWFGAGIGNMGAVGKNVSELTPEELTVAESYYLKVFVEGGIFFGLAFVVLIVNTLKRTFILLKHNSSYSFVCYIFLFFFLDCFMSMTLEYVIGSILFWISIAIINNPLIIKNNQYL